MTDPRLRHQCHKAGCDTEARWAVHLSLHAKVTGRQPIAMDGMTTIRCCDLHRNAASRYLLAGEHKDAINKTFRDNNIPLPDWDSARVEFFGLDEASEPDRKPAAPLEPKTIVACDRAACVLPAKFQIGLKLWRIGAKKTTTQPARILTAYCVCAEHMKKTRVQDILDEEAKSTMLGVLTERGFPMPDFRGAEIEFVPMFGGRMADPAMYERGQVGEAA